MNIGSNLTRQKQRHIDRFGTTIVLDKAPPPDPSNPKPPLKALRVDDQRAISRYTGTDGLDGVDKVPVLFVFPGTLHGPNCPFVHNDGFLCAGTPYTIVSLHPVFVGEACVELPVLAYKS